jgi:hypothetical protein
MDIDNVIEITKDFDKLTDNELRYLCTKKYMSDIFWLNKKTVTGEEIRIFFMYVNRAKKEDLIHYLLNE